MFFATVAVLFAAVAQVAMTKPVQSRQLAQVYTSCTVPNTAALTFDDGPYIYMSQVVDTLNANNASGTFFLNGNNWDCIYDQVDAIQYAYKSGHQISSHTWAHLDLTTLDWDQIHNQFWLVEQAVMQITGAYVGMMRPPYGSYNDLVQQVASVRGQVMITWDFDSGDSDGASVEEQQSNYDALVAARPDNVLALNHETYQTTVIDTLPYAISVLQAAGYNLVTVAECLGMDAYQWVGEAATPDDTWTCSS